MKNSRIISYLYNVSSFFIALGLILLFSGFTGDLNTWNKGIGLLLVTSLSLLVANSFVIIDVRKQQVDILKEISSKLDQ